MPKWERPRWHQAFRESRSESPTPPAEIYEVFRDLGCCAFESLWRVLSSISVAVAVVAAVFLLLLLLFCCQVCGHVTSISEMVAEMEI